MQLIFDTGVVSDATTWVVTAPGVAIPFLQEALDQALKQKVFIGLHIESRSIIVHFNELQGGQRARSKLETIFGAGGAPRRCLDSVEAFDIFHAESWGLVTTPGVVVPSMDRLVEVLELQTADEQSFRNELEAGGPISDFLERALFPRDRFHVQRVQEESSALATLRPMSDGKIHWLGPIPPTITVYMKPKMPISRRIEYIKFRASVLDIELDAVSFMTLFKQVSCYHTKFSLIQYYKEAMKQFQSDFDWGALDAKQRLLIVKIADGADASHVCTCPKRMVVDYAQMDLDQARIGDYHEVQYLVGALKCRRQVEAFTLDKFTELEELRELDECCEASSIFPDLMCDRCS